MLPRAELSTIRLRCSALQQSKVSRVSGCGTLCPPAECQVVEGSAGDLGDVRRARHRPRVPVDVHREVAPRLTPRPHLQQASCLQQASRLGMPCGRKMADKPEKTTCAAVVCTESYRNDTQYHNAVAILFC